MDGKIAICTVIGFPNGYNTTEIKCAEAAQAVKEGAAEIDMVINIGWAKEGRWDDIFCEINKIKEACDGRLPVSYTHLYQSEYRQCQKQYAYTSCYHLSLPVSK